jgi:carboxymethylenebutenolidase
MTLFEDWQKAMREIMKTIVWLTGFYLLLSTGAFAATVSEVTYKSGDETVKALLYTPVGRGPFPAIVVIHEWWGLNDWVKEQASRLAGQGYAALAIDLFRGQVADNSAMAHELSRRVPQDRALRDLHAAVEFLKSQPNVKKNRIASIGWCWGGGFSLQVALEEPTLTATVINYGSLVTEAASIQKIHAAVLGNFGGKDKGIPPEDVQQFEAALKQAGKRVDIKVYPDAGHAFENPTNKNAYRAADAADAWQRTVKFLNETLKK